MEKVSKVKINFLIFLGITLLSPDEAPLRVALNMPYFNYSDFNRAFFWGPYEVLIGLT